MVMQPFLDSYQKTWYNCKMIKNSAITAEQLLAFLDKLKNSSFRARLRIESLEGCWLWTGAKMGDGYGVAGFKGKQRRAHILFVELFWNYPVNYKERREVVMHACNTRLCCNPQHLLVGTQSNNMLHYHHQVFTQKDVLAKLSSEIEESIK